MRMYFEVRRRHCEEQSDEAILSWRAATWIAWRARHRARVRPTRWLAMTVSRRATLTAVTARLDLAIQHSRGGRDGIGKLRLRVPQDVTHPLEAN
jgi:hypothetical protein